MVDIIKIQTPFKLGILQQMQKKVINNYVCNQSRDLKR